MSVKPIRTGVRRTPRLKPLAFFLKYLGLILVSWELKLPERDHIRKANLTTYNINCTCEILLTNGQ